MAYRYNPLFDIFNLGPTPEQRWLEEYSDVLPEYAAHGLRFNEESMTWERIPGTPPPPNGLIVLLPPKAGAPKI